MTKAFHEGHLKVLSWLASRSLGREDAREARQPSEGQPHWRLLGKTLSTPSADALSGALGDDPQPYDADTGRSHIVRPQSTDELHFSVHLRQVLNAGMKAAAEGLNATYIDDFAMDLLEKL